MPTRPQGALGFLRSSETVAPFVLAVGVGLLAGGAVIGFDHVMRWSQALFFDVPGQTPWIPGRLHIVILPALGLLATTLLVARHAPEAVGTGIPQVMYAVRRRGGIIRKRTAPFKALGSVLTIGAGGSVGREGPVVHIGAGLGSTLAQALGLRESRVQLLVACGAAAAIGANFDAPIAGAIFALEVILGSFHGRDFGMVVLSSVSGTVLARAFLGDQPAFRLPQSFTLENMWELPLYLVLGLLAAFAAMGFRRTVYALGDRVAQASGPPWLKAIGAGLAVGAMAWAVAWFADEPWLLGVGYNGIEAALAVVPTPGAAWSLQAMALLLAMALLKPLATGLTLAGGGSGGVFAPSLFVGAMLGGAFGLGVGELFGEAVAPPGAYALVGMGAVFAAAAHAPISAVLILFEMSDNYLIILPLMLAVGEAYLVASRLDPESLYSVRLRRLGGFEPQRPEAGVLDLILVADAMVPHRTTVRPDLPLSDLALLLHGQALDGVPVLDEAGRLVGIVTATDLWNELTGSEDEREGRTVGDVMTRELVTATPGERLREVLSRLHEHALNQVLVVDRENPELLLGVLRRREIFWAFGEMMTEHQKLVERSGLDLPEEAVQVALQVRAEHKRLAFRHIRDLGLPDGALVLVLRRGGRALVPQGDTLVEPGDVLVLVTTVGRERALRGWLDRASRSGG